MTTFAFDHLPVPDIRTPLPGPNGAEMLVRDQRYVSPSYTPAYPLFVERGSGAVIQDVDGNLFLDFTAGIAVTNTGHCHPEVVAAIQDQAAKLLHMSGTDFYYRPQIDLAERLAKLGPGPGPKKVFFANSGAEALEGALKLARFHTKRSRVVSFFGAFHGRTYGAMSLSGSKLVHRRGFSPLVPDIHHLPFPRACPEGCKNLRTIGQNPSPTPPLRREGLNSLGVCSPSPLGGGVGEGFRPVVLTPQPASLSGKGEPEPSGLSPSLLGGRVGEGCSLIGEIEDTLFKRTCPPEEVAAIFVEPVQGEGGYHPIPHGCLTALRTLCDKYGILLVADEVQSGMGRTGKMWAVDHYGVEPDIVCSAKGIASGMPLGAIIAKADVMDWPPGSHASTFGGNPVSCRAALATIDLLEREYLANATARGEQLRAGLRDLGKTHAGLTGVRGLGLMTAADLPSAAVRERVIETAFHRGLLLLGCGDSAIRFCPPLCVSAAQVETALAVLGGVLADGGLGLRTQAGELG